MNSNNTDPGSETAAYISLREVGRRLHIPPSTVVYYKDRFERFIPAAGSSGRRRRYPVESLAVFRRIREMFEKNWSVEQIEQDLALRFSGVFDGPAGAAAAAAPAPAREGEAPLAAVLEKMSDLLDNQSLFRSEIRSLRDEVATLRRERAEDEARQAGRIRTLEDELEALRRLVGGVGQGNSLEFPPAEYLGLPLVIRAAQGDYLGVLGRDSRPFALQDFVALLERNVVQGERVGLAWSRDGEGGWNLDVTAGPGAGRRIALSTLRTLTPSRNVVALVRRLSLNGQDAPESLLLSLFRQIRESFGG